MNDRFELTLGQLLGFARRGLYFGLALALLLGAGLFQWQSRSGPIYEAQAAIVVQSPQVHLSSIGLPEINYSPLHVDAYRVVALSDQTIAAGLRAIGQPATPATVGELRQGGLQVRAILESRLLYILVAADSPQKAADLANAIAAQLQTWDLARVTEELRAVTQLLSQSATVQQLIIQELQGQEGAEAATQLGNAQRQVSDLRAQMDSVVALATNAMSNLQVLEAATPPEESAGRTPVMLALLGVILGLLLAYGIMFVVELLDGRFYTSEAVERLTHLPILGELARHRRGRSIDVDSTFALQATLENSLYPISQATILVVGTGPQDDTATTAMALAEGFARRGANTLLVDADLQHPTIAHRYQVPGIVGLSLLACVHGQQGTRQPLRVRIGEHAHLALLAEPKPSPEGVVPMLKGMPACLQRWKGEYHVIVVRVAPFPVTSDALILGPSCNGIVVAVDPTRTSRRGFLAALARLRRAGAPLVGAVVTGVKGRAGARSEYRMVAHTEAKPSASRPQPDPPHTA